MKKRRTGSLAREGLTTQPVAHPRSRASGTSCRIRRGRGFAMTGIRPFIQLRAFRFARVVLGCALLGTLVACPPFQQGTDGLLSIEAEHCEENVPRGAYAWTPSSQPGASNGAALEATPNSGVILDTGYAASSPRLDFPANFVRTGIHYIWARGLGHSASDDSFHVGLDGAELATSDRITGFGTDWTWSRATMDGPVATFNVPSVGVHTVNVWMREDGFIIDKIVITPDPNYVPTGMGPPESARASEGGSGGSGGTGGGGGSGRGSGGDWEGVYGVQSIERSQLEAEMTELQARGINLIVQNVMLRRDNPDPRYPGWKQYYEAAVRHGIRLIPVLWDPSKNQTVWDWDATANNFELDVNRYPNSPCAQFVKFLKDNPKYLQYTHSMYSFHEPFNPENGTAQRTVAQQRTLRRQIHDLFPNGSLKLYGESITHRIGCENGCVDYAANSLFSFSDCSGVPRYSALVLHANAATGIDIWYDRCIADRATVIQRGRDQIDYFYNHSHVAPPAPDGSYTKFLVLIQTYVENPADTVYSRMPETDEMYQWVQQIVLSRKDRVGGVMWYAWERIATQYQMWLKQNRYDTLGRDRWRTMSDVAALLRQ